MNKPNECSQNANKNSSWGFLSKVPAFHDEMIIMVMTMIERDKKTLMRIDKWQDEGKDKCFGREEWGAKETFRQ